MSVTFLSKTLKVSNFDLCTCPRKNVRKCDASGKNGIPSCCKGVFELIGGGRANLAHIQPVNLKCPKMRFWQKNVSSQMG